MTSELIPKLLISFITPIFNDPKSLVNRFSKFLSGLLVDVESLLSYDDIASSKAAHPNASLENGPA